MAEDYGLVSIITPSYNSAEFIADTINSILSQTYSNWELLVTDDCSTDNSRAIVQSYAARDARVRLFCLEKNSGAAAARNRSIEEARGRFIAFCDSDDRWYPEKLERQLRFMRERNCALSYTSYMVCDEQNRNTGIVVCTHRVSFASLKRDDGIGCLTAIYDTEKVGRVFAPDLRKRQDWGLWLRVVARCRIAYGMKEPLAYYRIRSGSISRNKMSLVRFNISVYEKVLGYSRIRASLMFLFVFLPSYFMKKLRLRIINA
ncbi:MAG: glycosyltransferase family 2 protein [Bacteroidaceae bacterium]|jgi:teichuronic acid biosynthesis glycosyltransferase TuaG